LQSLTTLLAHQSLAGFTLGCRTRLRRLLNQLGTQAIQLLIDRLLNLGQGCFRMRYSPLRDGGSGFLSWCFPVLLQVFWLHLGLALLDSWHNSSSLLSVPPFASTLPSLPSKQAAQKNATHPVPIFYLTYIASMFILNI
jgi:hypothetical protein